MPLTAPKNYGIRPGYYDPVTGMTYGPTYITTPPGAVSPPPPPDYGIVMAPRLAPTPPPPPPPAAMQEGFSFEQILQPPYIYFVVATIGLAAYLLYKASR